jgi:hypothetical protein
MARPDPGRCRGCGAPIGWIKLADTGRPTPVNLARVTIIKDDQAPDAVVVCEDGLVRRGRRIPPDQVAETGTFFFGYTSHFATCPNAQDFRKGGS